VRNKKVYYIKGIKLFLKEDEDRSEAGADNDEFDAVMNAQPTTNRTGINKKQRQKALNKQTATFSSGKVNALS
jgi:pre-rRNA-processing protein TSR3